MKLFEIPFQESASGGWQIPIPGNGSKQFHSRDQALAFAVSLAKEDKKRGLEDSLVCVEGADAQWRLFTPDLLPANNRSFRRR